MTRNILGLMIAFAVGLAHADGVPLLTKDDMIRSAGVVTTVW